MGQKVNPHGLRVGINAPWSSTWFANKKDFGKNLKEDNEIRNYLKKNYYDAAISSIKIDRAANNIKIDIYCGRVGVAVGKLNRARDQKAAIAASSEQLPVDTTAKKDAPEKGIDQINAAIRKIVGAGAKGVKTMVSGRLDGAEIARSESYHEGSIPLQTLRADIDYGFAEAHTTYGIIGVKAWIYKGEVFKAKGGKD